MSTSTFQNALHSDDFLITVELLTTRNDGLDNFQSFIEAYNKHKHTPGKAIPLPTPAPLPGGDKGGHRGSAKIAAITAPHSPGGVPTLDPYTVLSDVADELPDDLDAIAHVSCKDLNRNGLEAHLRNLRRINVRNILALTGDLPVDSKPVFELESLGLLRLIAELNAQVIGQTNPDELDGAFQFCPGAGVNPYKYTLASSWQQYAKMVKKIASGAEFLITQVGYDIIKASELMRYLRAHDFGDVPVFGNVFLLTEGAATRMYERKLPGTYASDALYFQVVKEWEKSSKGKAAMLERCAQQTAFFREWGFKGVHIGGVGLAFSDVAHIIDRSEEIYAREEPEMYQNNIHFPPSNPQYFIDPEGEFVLPETPPRPTFKQRVMGFTHSRLVNPDSRLAKAIVGASAERAVPLPLTKGGSAEGSGGKTAQNSSSACLNRRGLRQGKQPLMAVLLASTPQNGSYARLDATGSRYAPPSEGVRGSKGLRRAVVSGVERLTKGLLVQCQNCGDCLLPEQYYAICNESACAKGLANIPCGDADAITGRCGNDDETICAGELVFYAAFAVGKLGELSERINSPKIADLRGTSAVMNYFAGVDHRGRIAGKLRQKKPINLIEIGESIHAQIPRIYWAMNDVLRRSDGGKRLSGGLAHLIDVINRQMIAGADYIAVNVDAFPQRERPGLMRQYVNLVNSLSAGVGGMPVCIDSSDPVTKQAGLEAYYRTAENPREKPPIINSINIIDPQPILELKADHDFKVIAMLHDKIDAAGNPANVGNVDEVHDLARELFDLLVKTGFAPDDIFFDTAVVPIATDIDGTNTYKTMHGVARIMSDPAMKGVHTVIGLSNCSHMMPNRIAINRAYLQVAMEHGLDAAVLDPTIDYGMKDPGKQILSIITALAENDGTDAMKGFEIFEQIAEYSRKYGKTSNLVRGRSSSPPYQGGVRGG